MNPSNTGSLLHRPHVYVTRTLANGIKVSGYEPAPELTEQEFNEKYIRPAIRSSLEQAQALVGPSAADLDAIAAEQAAREATSKK